MRFSEELARRLLLFDGAMGTMVHASGVDLPDCPETLNLTHPELVASIHRQYAEAGADVLETNSLGLNAVSLRRHGLEGRLEALTEAAVRCALAGAEGRCLVALSMGPTGEMLSPLGPLGFDEVYQGYRRQAAAGWEAGADLMLVETMGDAAQARIAALACRENTPLPVVLSFTFEKSGRMLMGGVPETGAVIAEAAGCRAVGTNCSGGPDLLYPVLQKMKRASALPCIVQPNAGMPELLPDGRTRFPLSPAQMRERMRPIVAAGAAAIGGCCGTTPDTIRELKTLLAGLPAAGGSPAPRLVASERRFFPLEEAAARGETVDATDLEAVYDADPDAPAMWVDFRDMDAAEIPDWLGEAQTVLKMPLLFRVTSDRQAEAALRHYAGRAGIAGRFEGATCRNYGAYPL